MPKRKYRYAWMLYSPNGEFADTVFDDWFQLCAHLMGAGGKGKWTDFAIKACLIWD